MSEIETTIDGDVLDRLIEDIGLERLERLLRAFMDEAVNRMRRIRAAARARNLTALHEECHTLKGSASSFGAAEVAREAERIVAACLVDDGEGALGRVDGLEGLLNVALSAFGEWISLGAQGAAAPARPAPASRD